MCTGLEGALFLGAASLGSALLAPKPPDPPKLPAPTPDGSRPKGATVHVGDGQDKAANKDSNAPNRSGRVPETRSFGRAVGGNLGRSGLSI